MTLGKLLHEHLRQVANDGSSVAEPGAEGYHTLSVAREPATASVSFFDADRYSISLRVLEVSLPREVPADDTRAFLSATAAEIARRLSFLEEPLAVWELEGAERMAQLRSSPPQREGEQTYYWEVALRAGEQVEAQISRYHWTPGMPEREVEPYPATFALIARITDGLDGALRAE